MPFNIYYLHELGHLPHTPSGGPPSLDGLQNSVRNSVFQSPDASNRSATRPVFIVMVGGGVV